MRDVDLKNLLIAATSIFISGIIVFYVIFYAVRLMTTLQQSLGFSGSENAQRLLDTIRMIPVILAIIYAVLVFGIIYYLIFLRKGEGEEKNQYDLLLERYKNYYQKYR